MGLAGVCRSFTFYEAAVHFNRSLAHGEYVAVSTQAEADTLHQPG